MYICDLHFFHAMGHAEQMMPMEEGFELRWTHIKA